MWNPERPLLVRGGVRGRSRGLSSFMFAPRIWPQRITLHLYSIIFAHIATPVMQEQLLCWRMRPYVYTCSAPLYRMALHIEHISCPITYVFHDRLLQQTTSLAATLYRSVDSNGVSSCQGGNVCISNKCELLDGGVGL